MTSPLFNIGGLASGLDTSSIIEQLMAVERNPVVLMNQQRAKAQTKIDAWGAITTKMSSVRSSVDALRDLSDFNELTDVSTSDDDALSVTKTAAGGLGRLSFIVEQLADSHQMSSSTSFTSIASSVGAGTFTINSAGKDHNFEADTLENLVADINSKAVGVTASAVQVGESDYRLVLTASGTGEANRFTVGGDKAQLASFDELQSGQNAVVRMGDELTGLRVERASNTITDLVPGASITLKKATATPVTVESSRDIDGTIEKVTDFVKAANELLSQIKTLTKFDPDGDKDGPLIGDSTLRGIQNSLVSTMTGQVASLESNLSYSGALGLSYNKDGTFTLDETKLRTALEDDYTNVSQFFARSGSSLDGRARFDFASNDTKPGSYGVVVTQAATQAKRIGGGYSDPGSDIEMEIVNGETTVEVSIAAGTSIEAAIARINADLSTAGLGFLRASDEGGAIALTSLRYGSSGSFEVSGSDGLGLDGSASGQDVAGTIDGQAATGTGRTLTSITGDSDGLGITITVSPSELATAGGTIDLGSMGYSRGLMGELSELLATFEGTDGSIKSSQTRWENQIESIDEQIVRFENRLSQREVTLRRRFTSMETMLSTLQGQSSYLFSALASSGG